MIDMAIMNGFETITRLGGYILLFSVGAAGIRHFWPFSPERKICLSRLYRAYYRALRTPG